MISLRFISLFLAVALTAIGCKSPEKSASKSDALVDPEQVQVQIDTRFQEAFFKAMYFKNRGDWEKAAAAFEECVGIEPSKSSAAHYELSRIERINRGDPQSALAHIKSAVSLDEKNPWYRHELADVYLALGKYDLAIKEYETVEILNPDDPNNLYEQASALLFAGRLKDALAVYDRLEMKSGTYEELTLQKHSLYMELGEPSKAGLELEKLALAHPEEPRFWGMALRFYTSEGMADQASKALTHLESIVSADGMVHYQLSEYYSLIGQDAKSYKELRLAFETTDIGIDQKIGVLLRYFSLTDIDPSYLSQAYELLNLTEKLHPTEAKAFAIYGDFLYRDADDMGAIEKYRKAVELDPSRSQIWSQLVMIEAQNQEYVLLREDAGKAAALYPNSPEFYLYHGIASEQLKEYDDAIESFTIGKELVVDDPPLKVQFLSSLGGVYNQLQKHQESDDAYDAALLIEPNNKFVLNNYAYYLSLRKVRLEEAHAMAKKCNELQPGSATFQDTFAWVLYQQGLYDEALIWIEKAIQLNQGEGAELFEHYGDILFRLNRNEQAITQWKKSIALGGDEGAIQLKIDGHFPQ